MKSRPPRSAGEVVAAVPRAARAARRRANGWPLLIAFALSWAVVSGGCNSDPADGQGQTQAEKDKEKKEKEAAEKKKKKPFEVGKLTPLLSLPVINSVDQDPLPLIKPGHWTATVQKMRANYDNYQGRSVVAAVDSKYFEPLGLQHTPFSLVSSRPIVLAKNQPKLIENEIFLPETVDKVHISAEIVPPMPDMSISSPPLWSAMESHQYFFLVLASEPERYSYLKVTDTVRGPWEDDSGSYSLYYRVVLADGDLRPPLPPNVLTWTSVAYVLWDEVNLDKLDSDQQKALVDWIHWGGRLIINGPDSLAALRGSFLNEYLPADPGSAMQITEERLKPLVQYWGRRKHGKELTQLKPTQPWSAVNLKLRPGARFLQNTSELFCENNVGLGTVVVSAIQLSERDLINWPGYDGFLNGALLGRPSRAFAEGPYAAYRATWTESPKDRLNAYFTTPVRWFSRDAGTVANTKMRKVSAQPGMQMRGVQWQQEPNFVPTPDRPGGLGGWSEFSPIADAARGALREAAGVRVPAASFVVSCLAFYLVVLVPLNWLVFHALGRIEWAWIAAPVIALVGTVLIVQQANLDIGFVRAQTEIALLELQDDHPRGHLTRFTALYASLSTSYDMEFEGGSAVAKPFPSDNEFKLAFGDRRTQVSFDKYDKTRLGGVTITSASTRFVHSEQIAELEGGLEWSEATGGTRQIANRTGIDLQDAVIVHRYWNRRGQPALEGYWVGELRDGQSRATPMSPLTLSKEQLPFAEQRVSAAKLDYRKRLNVDSILQAAFQFAPSGDPHHARREEWRLVARADEVLPGAEVKPTPSQAVGTTVVLAHLAYGPSADQLPDVNSVSDVMSAEKLNSFEDVDEFGRGYGEDPLGELGIQ